MAILNVKTMYGEVEGIPGWNQAVSLFRGIPYAKAPVGDLRWKAPERPEPWEGTLKAYNFRNISYQERRPSEGGGTLIGDEFYCVDWPRDEDCLYLNIWTPASSADEKLPVGVYLHGGGYSQGYGYLNCYDGEGFAKRGCVFVTINHRLGIFGYFAHPELEKEDPNGSTGNYGEMDILAALQWIKENIASFGGDPDKVTIFGQSGGGDKVVTTLLSPLSKGLISGAIMQSGGGLNRSRVRTKEEEMKKGVTYLQSIGLHSIEEARKASSEELMEIARIASGNDSRRAMGLWGPMVDGYVFPENWTDTALGGDFPDLPTMIGCTAEEFLGKPVLPDRAAALADGEKNIGPGYGEDFLAAIRYDEDPEYAKEMYRSQVMMTGATQAADIAWCETLLKTGHRPAYKYFLTLVPPSADSAHHSAEHHYVFQTFLKSKRPYTGRDFDLSNQLASYWANFIKTGNPNEEGLPAWTPYTEDSRKSLDINYDLRMIEEPKTPLVRLMTSVNLKDK